MSFSGLDVDHHTWQIIFELEKENERLNNLVKELTQRLTELQQQLEGN